MMILAFVLTFLMLKCVSTENRLLVSDSHYQFAYQLYNKIAKNKNENVFYSPYSISSAMTMCLLGATENTEKQLRSLLGYDNLPTNLIKEQNLVLYDSLNKFDDKNLELNIANKIYLKKDFEIKPEFSTDLKKYFKSEIELVDFNEPQVTASKINSWVSMKTKQKIKDLIDADSLNEQTRLVLINAIYFKAGWLDTFDKFLTEKENFYLDDGSTKQVELMHMPKGTFKLRTSLLGLSLDVCQFPYVGSSVSMTIILPHKGVKLNEIENDLDLSKLKGILSLQTKPTKVEVYIPKFKFEQQFELKDVLSSMNAPDAFNSNASFKGITMLQQLAISKVIHKAVIEVSEEGTEAAAATAVSMIETMSCLDCGLSAPIPVFRCDRPFIFLIHENKFNTILFAGKYVK